MKCSEWYATGDTFQKKSNHFIHKSTVTFNKFLGVKNDLKVPWIPRAWSCLTFKIQIIYTLVVLWFPNIPLDIGAPSSAVNKNPSRRGLSAFKSPRISWSLELAEPPEIIQFQDFQIGVHILMLQETTRASGKIRCIILECFLNPDNNLKHFYIKTNRWILPSSLHQRNRWTHTETDSFDLKVWGQV